MKKKYLIAGLFSIFFGIGYSFGLEDGFYHNSSLGLISFVSGGNVLFTAQDKDLGATCTDVNADCSRGNLYQWGNDYGFSSSVAPTNISNNSINYTNYFGSSFNSNGVFYSNYYYSGIDNSDGAITWGSDPFPRFPSYQLGGPCSSGFTVGLQLDVPLSNISISGLSDYLFFRHYDYFLNTSGSFSSPFFNGFVYWSNVASIDYSDTSSIMFSDGSSLYFYFHDISNSEGLPVRCFSLDPVVPDNSWVYLNSNNSGSLLSCDQLLSGGSVQGTLTFYETDSGSYWTVSTGGISCRLTNWILSGDTVQLYSGTITLYDDYYTYTTSTGLVITTATGLDVNKGTWWNLLSKFSGHNLTVYETDSGFYYTFTNNSGEILTISLDEIFGYTDFDKHYTGISNNTITARRFYGDLSNSGFHWFTCGVDKNTIFSFKLSDYLRVADIIPKLDVNLLGFVSCPFYSLLAGISDNFDNATLIGSYRPILNQTGFYHKSYLYERNRLYTLLDWILIFILFIVFGSIFKFISKQL